MVAAIGGIGSASQNVKWGRPAKDPQQAHFEASQAMKEKGQPAQMSEHLKRTIELQQSGEKSVHMQALEDRMEKLASGQSLSVHMQAIASGLSRLRAAKLLRFICRRRSQLKEPPLHTTHPVVVVGSRTR